MININRQYEFNEDEVKQAIDEEKRKRTELIHQTDI